MKILQVISSFPPAYSYGGPAKMAYDTSKYLVKKGHEVTVYTTDVYDSESRLKYKENPMIMDGITVYHFKNISNNLAKQNVSVAPMMALALSKNINKFDVVHINEYRTLQAKFVQYYAKKYGVPYILQPRGAAPVTSKCNQKKIFDLLFGHDVIKDATKIIATSRIESNQYCDVFPEFNYEKVVHIPNPIDLEAYSKLPQKGEFKKKFCIDENEKIILFLSRIHERKGADLLIEAFSDLKRELNNVKLVIAGPDEGYLDELKSIANRLNLENHIIFPGPLYEKDKINAYVDADVFVLPSKDHYESFGNVVLEALACGTPVIVTNVCGVTEWIDGLAYVVESDPSQIKNAILDILSDEISSEKLSMDGKNVINNKFGSSVIASQIENIYRNVTNFG